MERILTGIVAAALISTPAQAGDWRHQAVDVQHGAFAGARIRLPLGGANTAQPRAVLTIAPTYRSTSTDGEVRTRIGEGLAFGLAPDRGPTVTLAGVRADRALGLAPGGQDASDTRIGLSTGGKVALGVGVLLLAGGVGYLVLANRCTECDQ